MLRVRIGLLCLAMMLILGMTLEAVGQNSNENNDTMCVPMGEIVLEPPASVENKRSPVTFPHSGHFGFSCKTCHHKWEGNAKVQNCTTAACHDVKTSPKKPATYLKYTDDSIKYFKYAFHSQCVGCHKEIKQERKKIEMSYTTPKEKLPESGPTGCLKCHPKQE